MTICRIDSDGIVPLERTTFEQAKLRERHDLQSRLKRHIDVIAEDTLIVGEEVSVWEDSQRRIDLLGIDKKANLVVFELKRTEGGGVMDLQAIRYAAMISTLTFDELVTIYDRYLGDDGDSDKKAKEKLLEFLEWEEPDEEQFGQEVRIVLASAEFSKELTTSVMWLNDYYGLDIRCVRMSPYANDDGQIFMDVQTVIPIPEATDYQVRTREKKQKVRESSRKSTRDYSIRYDVSIAGKHYPRQRKRRLMLLLMSYVLKNGGTPEQLMEAIPWRKKRLRLFESFEGELSADQVRKDFPDKKDVPNFFCKEDSEVLHVAGRTYVFNKRWGQRTLEAVSALKEAFPNLKIEVEESVQPARSGTSAE